MNTGIDNLSKRPQITSPTEPVRKLDLQSASEAKQFMEQSTNDFDWDKRCDAVKAANGNRYPSFWKELAGDGGGYPAANGSLYDRVRRNWTKPANQP
jgi:hypothetical protein